MTLRIKVLIVLMLFIALAGIVNKVRKRKLDLKYVLGWILCDITLMIFVIFPQIMKTITVFLGIQTPANMVFFMGFLFSIMLIFSLTTSTSRETERIRKLAQRMALREYEEDYEQKD